MTQTDPKDGERSYQALRRQLLDQIVSGKFPVGTRFHSVREVARWPNATTHLAQRALAELCRDGYLESVPKKGLFVRGQAQRVRPPTAGAKLMLFLVPPGAFQSRVNEMLPAISPAIDLARWRMEVVYMQPDYDHAGGFEFAELLIARHPSAIVWLMPQASDMLLVRYLVSSGVSVVTYNRDFTQTGAIGVVADVSDVAGKLFDAVYDQGARRIACLSIDKVSPSIRQFVDVAVHRAAERGMNGPLRTTYLPYSEAKFLTDEVHQRVDDLMSRPDRPDGIVCAESYSLLALEWWLSEHPEMRVPEDLAVASFDRQISDSVVRVMPPIYRGDFDQLGMMEAAIELVEMQLGGRRIESPLRVVPAILLPPSGDRRRTPNGSAQPALTARS